MMTEAEAREKWCPFVRRDASQLEALNGASGGWSPCIGSSCMAWRWDSRPIRMDKSGKELTPGAVYLAKDVVEKENRKDGYCGMVGQ